MDSKSPVVISRAPGRLDVMGGIADYSGSLVLQQTIREATFIALQRTSESNITLKSLSENDNESGRSLVLPADLLMLGGQPMEYEPAAGMFRAPDRHWASYVIGVCLVLMHERNLRLDGGMKIVIGSNVPEGKGV